LASWDLPGRRAGRESRGTARRGLRSPTPRIRQEPAFRGRQLAEGTLACQTLVRGFQSNPRMSGKVFGAEFKPEILVRYPPGADVLLEPYFYDYFTKRHGRLPGWTYIDVFWTNLYVNREQGKTPYDKSGLVRALAELPRRRYFTVVQHAGGVAECLPERTVVFGAGSARTPHPSPDAAGSRGGRALQASPVCVPLVYANRNDWAPACRDRPKTIFCSFVGAFTHPVRVRMAQELSRHGDVELHVTRWKSDISPESAALFVEKTSRSVFTLCPRGHGPTSFRFYEALALGSIPVYVWDEYQWLPYRDLIDYDRLCVSIHVDDLRNLHSRLRDIGPAAIADMRLYYRLFQNLFTLRGTTEWILDLLRVESAEARASR
jgi:hypothetical protein